MLSGAREGNAPSFSFPLRPLSLLAGLDTSVNTQAQGAALQRAEGPGMKQGPAQESVELLSSARLPCLFALTSHWLQGYKTCFMKGTIVLQKKICYKYLS